MIEIGLYNNLEILRDTTVGMYLADEEGNDILLPTRYVDEDFKIGDKIDVFVYKDSEDRIVATTDKPKILLNEFAYLKVNQTNKFGAFLEWGPIKDLFVPFSEQKLRMQEGHSYVVYMYLDSESEKLVASSDISKFLQHINLTVEQDQEVDLLVYEETDLGFNVIINDEHKGLIYRNEVYKPLKEGSKLKGYIKNIREDNKIDIVIQKPGYDAIDDVSKQIIKKLNIANGFLALNDKSSPEDIKDSLQMSKKTFKKAIGSLYRKKIIEIKENGIYLIFE